MLQGNLPRQLWPAAWDARTARCRGGHRQRLSVPGPQVGRQVDIGPFIRADAVQTQLLGEAALPAAKERLHAPLGLEAGGQAALAVQCLERPLHRRGVPRLLGLARGQLQAG